MTNEEILKNDWKQLRGKMRKRWHSLSDQDIDIVDGNLEVLTSMLQEKYSYSRELAEEEASRFLEETAPQRQHIPS